MKNPIRWQAIISNYNGQYPLSYKVSYENNGLHMIETDGLIQGYGVSTVLAMKIPPSRVHSLKHKLNQWKKT